MVGHKSKENCRQDPMLGRLNIMCEDLHVLELADSLVNHISVIFEFPSYQKARCSIILDMIMGWA